MENLCLAAEEVKCFLVHLELHKIGLVEQDLGMRNLFPLHPKISLTA